MPGNFRSTRPIALVTLAVGAACLHRGSPAPSLKALEGPESAPRDVELSDEQRKAKVLAALPELEEQFAHFFDEHQLPGMAVGIVVAGELVSAKGFGFRDLEAKAPVDADTLFRIASMTKSFTALAVLKLRDEGKLSLEDPVSKYVPELSRLAYPTRDSAPITLRELLSHSAGFPEDNAWGDPRLDMSEAEFSSMLREGLSSSSAPGTQFEYANLGFALLGRVVQRVSGTRYSEYVTRQILHPLGMNATTWDAKDVPPARLAIGYGSEAGPFQMIGPANSAESTMRPERQLADGAFGAMGGLYTSARDYARYVAFQLDAWPPRDEPERGPVRRSSAREAQQMARFVGLRVGESGGGELTANALGYGLGWGVFQSCDLDRAVGHSGGLPGFGSYVLLLPEHGIGLFAMTNATYAGPSTMLVEAARTLKAKGALLRRYSKPSAALNAAQHVVFQLLEHWDQERASQVFDRTFFQYNPPDQLGPRLRSLRERHGSCRPAGAMEPENALRGTLRLSCDRGQIDAVIALTADNPPRIQWVQLHNRLPPSDRLVELLRKLTQAIEPQRRARVDELLAPTMDRERVNEQLSRAGERDGPCQLERWLEGDGQSAVRAELRCREERLEMDIRIDPSSRVTQMNLRPAQRPSSKCPVRSR